MNIFLENPFLIRALLAGVAVAIVCGVLGCFVVWRRMAYFGDSLAHSSLLGVALGMYLSVDATLTTIAVSLVFALSLLWLESKKLLATDTLLGILAHAALSFGIVAITFLKNPRFDINTYLFGDILTVTAPQIEWMYIGGVVILLIALLNWSSFLMLTINPDLARAEGINILLKRILFIFVMTLIVAISLRIVGILLITSMLIIPAATARQFSRSPEQMAIISVIIGVVSVLCGIYFSYTFDIPSGPAIVCSAASLFAALFPISLIYKR